MRILFLTDDREDYLADSLFHGLHQLGDIECVDYPRKDILYNGYPDVPRSSIRGGGFTLYKLLNESDTITKRHQIWQQLETGLFDAVIISNIWRQWGLLLQWRSLLKQQSLILLDGDDDERHYPTSSSRHRMFGIGTGLKSLLQQPSTRLFKREWTFRTRFNPNTVIVHETSFSIPEEKIVSTIPEKYTMFPRHIVDKEVAQRIGAITGYAFTHEDDYRQNLAESRFGITLRRGGWDCLRHYEIAAAGAIPCFRNLLQKPPHCAPHGLKDGENCIAYEDVDHLLKRLQALTPNQELTMRLKALQWAKDNSTRERALEILHQAGLRPRT